ncbi:MAG: ATP-binding cassette domain-containing protein, partial [Saprospiraceae bacterium]
VTDLELESSVENMSEINQIRNGMSVNISQLYFKYPDAVEYSLQDLSFDIETNEKVCLTGSNGSGKSTLLKLMTAFFEPERGSILYDGLSIKNYDTTHLRSLIAECISDDRIFNGSLLENLTVGRNINLEEVVEMMNHTGLNEFINNLPQGYDTQIGPQGKRLPGSVNQKIVLARNLLKRPRLLIVEDIFRNLEKQEKIEIFKYILSHSEKRTVIILSKDPDIIKLTDRIITMDDGHIASNK